MAGGQQSSGVVWQLCGDCCCLALKLPVLSRCGCWRSSEDDIVAAVEASIPERCQLAVFDVITSNTALLLPVERLVQLCRARWGLRGTHAAVSCTWWHAA